MSKEINKYTGLIALSLGVGALGFFVIDRRKSFKIKERERKIEMDFERNNSSKKEVVYAGVEAGGTSFSVAIAIGNPENIIEEQRIRFDTTTPDETLKKVVQWLKEREIEIGPFDALGIASFGPLELDINAEMYGCITTTPKIAWQYANILGAFDCFKCCKGFDTDVNAAAMAQQFAYSTSYNTCAYVTVGTGVGVGIIAEGNPVHGVLHPEMGHIFSPRFDGDEFEGVCTFHQSCIEGMVTNVAIARRLDCGIDDLPSLGDDLDVWDCVAHYLAHLCVTLTLTISPEVIVLGGGVMNRSVLFPKIRSYTMKYLNGYIDIPQVKEGNIDKYIIPSPYGNNAGLVGAMTLAQQSLCI